MPEQFKRYDLPQLIILFATSIGLLLASSLGVFDVALSVSEHIQSGYRVSINNFLQDTSNQFDIINEISSLKDQRDQYKDEVIELREQISKQQKELDEYKSAKAQIDSNFDPEYNYIPAKIVRFDMYSSGILYLNKGGNEGLSVGDVVVYRNYAVAEIVEVDKYNSRARTIYSSESKVAVSNSTDARGILVSRNGNELEVDKILNDAEVKVGDMYYTLGLNSNFPSGLFVGEVVEINSSAADPTKNLILKNELDINSISEVYIMHRED